MTIDHGRPFGKSGTESHDAMLGEFVAHFDDFRWIPSHLYLQVYPPVGTTRERLAADLGPLFDQLDRSEKRAGGSGLEIDGTVGRNGEFRYHLIPNTEAGAVDRLRQALADFEAAWRANVPTDYRHEIRLCER